MNCAVLKRVDYKKAKRFTAIVFEAVLIIIMAITYSMPVSAAEVGGVILAAGNMSFFTSAIDTMKLVVCAIGAGMAVLGIINYLEGYSNDNAGSKSQGVKQLMAGGGIFIIGLTLVPLLSSVFS